MEELGHITFRELPTVTMRLFEQYYDVKFGFYYTLHRYYEPISGRYLIPDLIHSAESKENSVADLSSNILGIPQGLNLYLYVQNSPTNFIDPEGLLRYNKPPPITVPPPFPVRLKLHCMEFCLFRNLGISGGAEKSGHNPGSKHYTGQAADISFRMNPGLTSEMDRALCCALRCGFAFALVEGDHLHVQTVRGKGGSRGDLPTICECIRYILWPW